MAQTMTDPKAGLHWTQTAPGRYERGLDGVERFMEVWADTAAPFKKKEVLVHGVVTYKTDRTDMVEAFKKAWIAIRHRYPSMAAFSIDGKSVYLQNESLDTWLGETFNVSSSTPEEVFANTPPKERPDLFVFPESKEVMIRAHHERLDASGTLLFMDALFDIVDNPVDVVFGDEHERLSLPFDVIANVPYPPSPGAVANAQEQVQGLLTPETGLPARNIGQTPGDAAVEEITLSVPETDAIIRACKARGLTVTHATQAAILTAKRTIAGKDGASVCLIPVCLRSIAGDKGGDFSVEQTSGAFFVFPPGDFAQTAQRVKEKVLTIRPETYDLGVHQAVCELLEFALQQPPPPEPSTVPELSAIGIVEKYMKAEHGRTEITKFRQLVTTITPKIRSSSWSFEGRFHMTASYNKTYYLPEDVQNFLRTWRAELHKGLGIEIAN